ncbi:hypothetical protein [Leuconostoc lactis]|uniref:hypothetical protein n=1 Tax=Leuconostoc lactis TaxID=1246 RepID=UPI0009F4627B|nr:hypothetical protein [Leuconostoc lactis]MSB66348.1 hypothetical protein [Leuconostoc lactis]RYS88208.1 hypothetical protein EAI73_04305 [Leuconostoc lactis]
MGHIVLHSRRSAFILGEALVTFGLLNGLLLLEYEQVTQYKQQVQRLEKRYQVAQQERLAAMKAWHTYDQP